MIGLRNGAASRTDGPEMLLGRRAVAEVGKRPVYGRPIQCSLAALLGEAAGALFMHSTAKNGVQDVDSTVKLQNRHQQ
jgi:hypothetical protein